MDGFGLMISNGGVANIAALASEMSFRRVLTEGSLFSGSVCEEVDVILVDKVRCVFLDAWISLDGRWQFEGNTKLDASAIDVRSKMQE